jgi:cation-transporting P-type ATPase I
MDSGWISAARAANFGQRFARPEDDRCSDGSGMLIRSCIAGLRALNPAPRAQAVVGWLGNTEGRRQRRIAVSSDGRRAHIEVRGANLPNRAALVRDVERALTRLDGVDWAEVDAIVGRVVVAFHPESVSADDLVAALETVEDAHDAAGERFPHDRPDHPADREPIQRNVFAIAASVGGVGVATGMRALRFARIPAEIAGVGSIAESQPRVRRFVENRLGRPATDATLVTVNALAQALGQGPLGLVVDVAHRVGIDGELRARRAVWQRREPDLFRDQKNVRHAALTFTPRSKPLPRSPVERYSDRAAIGSLGGFALALGLTRNARRASDLLLVGIPKAATMGRDTYAALLDRVLASKGVITMDPAALRRLDRVDALVLDARVAISDSWSIEEVVPFTERGDLVECTLRARSLFDLKNPGAVRRRGAWTLAQFDSSLPTPRGAKSQCGVAANGGRRVLGLWRDKKLRAFVAVLPEPAPLVRELVEAARAAGLDVSLAGGSDAFARHLDIESRLEGDLAHQLRGLQEAGRVPMLVGAHDPVAHRAADVGVGVETAGERTPWGAHLVIGSGLGNAWRLVDAIPTARAVSRRSALIALGGASTGGIWSLVGPTRSAAQRLLLATNAAALLSIAMGAIAGLQSGARVLPRPGPRHRWHELDPGDALALLESSPNGLAPEEQARRRATTTARVADAAGGVFRAVVDELENPLTPVLAVGAGLSAALGSVTDGGLVIGVVAANALVGAAQKVKTERSLRSLEEVGDSPVRIRIGGTVREVAADQLVVGDVIELEAGDAVRADCRLLESILLEADESAITGESLPVPKTVDATPGAPVAERASMLYEGSVIASGRAVALVVAVGQDTEAGRSASAAPQPPPSGVERRLDSLTRLTIPITLAGGAVVTGLGFLHRRGLRNAVGTGVALAVAAVPEGLPALATVAQIAAARRLASRNALVRNPRALEALGRVDQVCFDKTGTLTRGSISVVRVSDGQSDERLGALSEGGRAVLAAALRATPTGNGGDILPHATDRAIALAGAAAGVTDRFGMGDWDPLEEIPFESRRGYHAVLGDVGNGTAVVTVKGAPEVVVPLAGTWRRGGETIPLEAAAREVVDQHVEELGRRGLRVLAVAEAPQTGRVGLRDATALRSLELVGFVSFADLVRPTAAAAVQDLRAGGVRVAMITGDHPSTAEAIAAELGLLNGGRVVTGTDLDQLSDEELDKIVPEIVVFARVTPLHKVRIVEAYQRAGRSVAMTGDGANDAAAIRLADAGIALGGRGMAAARAAADVVVVDDHIETIVDSVAEGRAMWDSVRDAIAILVGGNLGELGFILASSAITGTSPLNPRQLLLVNLLTDVAPALALALREPPDRTTQTLLRAGPEASLGGRLARRIAVRAGATATGATAAWVTARMTGTRAHASTVALAALVGAQLGQTLVAGGRSPLVLGATAVSAAALIAVVQTPGVSHFFGCRPLGPLGWLTAAGTSAGATAASIAVPWTVARVGEHIKGRTGRPELSPATYGSEPTIHPIAGAF